MVVYFWVQVAEFGEAKPPAERTPELLPVADNEAITITPVILYPGRADNPPPPSPPPRPARPTRRPDLAGWFQSQLSRKISSLSEVIQPGTHEI